MSHIKTTLISMLTGLITAGIFCSTIYVFATATYQPGDTLDPACNPNDPTCQITSPAYFSFGTNNFSGTGNFTTSGTLTGGALQVVHSPLEPTLSQPWPI